MYHNPQNLTMPYSGYHLTVSVPLQSQQQESRPKILGSAMNSQQNNEGLPHPHVFFQPFYSIKIHSLSLP